MRQTILVTLLLVSLSSGAQSVFGYWYGTARVKTSGAASNYMIELILQPDKGAVKGVLNYYFKDAYRSLQVKGTYDAGSRKLILNNVPVTYFGSVTNFQIDCIMNMMGTLRVAQTGSNLSGAFYSLPDYKNTCFEIGFNLSKNADLSKVDSVLKAISEFKENYQVWKPTPDDTIASVAKTITPLPDKVTNYPTEKEYTERENVITNEIEVESDTVQVGIYDNGEIDGDIISIFYNQKLVLYSQKLTHKSIRIKLPVDSLLKYNEISMFAENLGLIPPNTALMIIDDGKNRYELRLSSSLEKNATVRIIRKKKGVKATSNE